MITIEHKLRPPICMYVCIQIYVCVDICIYVYVCMYICIYIYMKSNDANPFVPTDTAVSFLTRPARERAGD